MPRSLISYKITFEVKSDLIIQIGNLGEFTFPRGQYIYSGSAKRNIERRIARHLSKEKKIHWHIDYLLSHPDAEVISIEKSVLEECNLNKSVDGEIIAPGFGSSDCRNNCLSHLKRLTTKRNNYS